MSRRFKNPASISLPCAFVAGGAIDRGGLDQPNSCNRHAQLWSGLMPTDWPDAQTAMIEQRR
jgi:hypothetical protein